MESTYSKLADLGIVNTHDLVFLVCTKAESRNEVENEQDNASTEERVRSSRHRVSELVPELDIVVVDPASSNFSGAIKVCNVIPSEKLVNA